MNREELEQVIYERTRYFVDGRVMDCIFELIAEEREACAKVCDDHHRPDADLQQGIWVLGTAITLAAAIRARGEVPR